MLHDQLQQPPAVSVFIVMALAFAAIAAILAQARGRKAWQGAVLGFFAWFFALVLIDLWAEPRSDDRSNLMMKKPDQAIFEGLTAGLKILAVNVLAFSFFALVIHSMVTGSIPNRHGTKILFERRPTEFYLTIYLLGCSAALFTTMSVTGLIYYVMGGPPEDH